MFTYDGLKKIYCSLHGDFVVVRGEYYKIKSCKDITRFKSRTYIAAILMITVAIVSGAGGYLLFLNGDNLGSLLLLIPFAVAVPVVVLLLKSAQSQNKCRSLWKINLFHTLCIESTDDPETENVFLGIPPKLETTSPLTAKAKVAILMTVGLPLLFVGTALLSFLFLSEGTKYNQLAFYLFFGYCVSIGLLRVFIGYRNRKWKK